MDGGPQKRVARPSITITRLRARTGTGFGSRPVARKAVDLQCAARARNRTQTVAATAALMASAVPGSVEIMPGAMTGCVPDMSNSLSTP